MMLPKLEVSGISRSLPWSKIWSDRGAEYPILTFRLKVFEEIENAALIEGRRGYSLRDP